MTPPITTLPGRPWAWEPLETALRQPRPVHLTYHRRQRQICPHALGWNDTRPMLLGYQTPAPTDTPAAPTDPRAGWRCMNIDEIDRINTAGPASQWVTANSYNPARPFPAIDHVTIAI